MRYRKRPVVVEAVQWINNNVDELRKFVPTEKLFLEKCAPGLFHLSIFTLEGVMRAGHGDMIIRGVNGEFYPCKIEIFEKTYEKAEPEVTP